MAMASTQDMEFLHTLSILYVEDEEEVRLDLARFLRRRFASVDLAGNGREGLAQFRPDQHDAVITDIKMPLMDGLDMAASIKSLAMDVPIIVVTAYNEIAYFMRAIEIGIDSYVKKPVNPDELIEAVRKTTRVRQQQRQLEKANRQLLSTMETTVAALARAIEKRDPYTDGHQKRVSLLAASIAEDLGLSSDQVTGIRLGAMIHDIGKICIPAELLTMPRRLTPIEFDLIKTHALAGAEILGDIEFPWPICQMVAQHHERLNGSGYPDGLKDDAILPEAKIIAVADVVEAMASHRPYRPGKGLQSAMDEIIEKRGELYSQEAVDACLRVLRNGNCAGLFPA